MKWDRIRFKANHPDYRPVKFPPKGPYWCSGFGENYSIVVAYFPEGSTLKDVREWWPEAEDLDIMQSSVDIEYSSRFSKPEWYEND